MERHGSWVPPARLLAALPLAALLLAALLLSGCDDQPPQPAMAASPQAPIPQAAPASSTPPARTAASTAGDDATAAADASAGAAQGAAETRLPNDPSAPADTPLCGRAARETNALGQSLLPRQYALAGSCASYACYDPATATYIGADGYRHVCR